MTEGLPAFFATSAEVQRARQLKLAIVALESTVITHGLPRPRNRSLAEEIEAAVRNEGAVPATVAVMGGKILLGLTSHQLEELALAVDPVKVSQRDLAGVLARKMTGGTTVAGTMYAAERAGIHVFATGGIGGVHRVGQAGQGRFDVSADLQALARTPMLVVCAGAKSILDLPATLEYLETVGVPVVGWQTDTFPAFFSASSGLPVTARVDTLEELMKLAHTHWSLGFSSAVLVCQPLPEPEEVPHELIDPAEERADWEAKQAGISGQAVTPFLLQRINELTGGRSLKANERLLINNAQLAAQIAKAFVQGVGRLI